MQAIHCVERNRDKTAHGGSSTIWSCHVGPVQQMTGWRDALQRADFACCAWGAAVAAADEDKACLQRLRSCMLLAQWPWTCTGDTHSKAVQHASTRHHERNIQRYSFTIATPCSHKIQRFFVQDRDMGFGTLARLTRPNRCDLPVPFLSTSTVWHVKGRQQLQPLKNALHDAVPPFLNPLKCVKYTAAEQKLLRSHHQ